MPENSKVIVIVQSRLGSTRLPGKGLLPLGNKPVIAHVLDTIHQVPAAAWYLATDEASFPRLKEAAESCGFEPFAGSADDVPGRFCAVVEKFRSDRGYLPEIIVRATGDNPFLFGTAACASVDQYYSIGEETGVLPAYFTLTGLPHGSGIEILQVESLLKARDLTDDPYDHEHVGPALYRHQDMFTCVFKPAPACWNHPELRTTIDTAGDYQKARRLYHHLCSKNGMEGPFEDQSIVSAFEEPCISRPILLIPSITADHGTGHFRRCAQIARELTADLYVGNNELPLEFRNVLDEYHLNPWQLVTVLPDLQQMQYEPGMLYRLVVLDQFISDPAILELAARLGPVASIDEGAAETGFAQYLLDIIPAPDAVRTVNDICPGCIPLPENRKAERPRILSSALVCIGGQDPAGITAGVTATAEKEGLAVTAVTKDNPVPNLKEQLHTYDLVITHYGFTAFEALAAGCAVILVCTTPLHEKLAEKYGFACLKKLDQLPRLLKSPDKLFNDSFAAKYLSHSQSLSEKVDILAQGINRSCPVCGKNHSWIQDPVVFRGTDRTFRRCRDCDLVYLSWSQKKESDYAVDYFFEDYKKQYGKTYLEDFDAIKKQGLERASVIRNLLDDGSVLKKGMKPRVLDIGCAFGPFLAAAAEKGFDPEGIDINKEAVAYVRDTLGFPAEAVPFPFDEEKKCSMTAGAYDAVTMWYVIEHLADLESSLKICNELLVTGGVFAFSTPDLDGVTGTYFPEKFCSTSPIDHLSLWRSRNCATVLQKFGFRPVQIISTGHHPERFPGAQSVKPGTLKYRYLLEKSKRKHLGDTCQIYCVKTEGLN